MSRDLTALRTFLSRDALALVEITSAKGSTPREAGAWMLVSVDASFGTIGGGQLEYMAIDKARQMLRNSGPRAGGTHLSVPLGPEIGQCCGGFVEVAIKRVDDTVRQSLLEAARRGEQSRPHVYLFGGGHVGHALASALALLPVRPIVVETRAEALEGLPAAVEPRLTAVPEDVVREAPPGSAFVILTHDHALDFLIVSEALKRSDAAYVGMIGSQTKRATFRNWYFRDAGGRERDVARLVSPIGGAAIGDKRPAVIAALAAAEIVTALSAWRAPAPEVADQGDEEGDREAR